MTDRDKRSAAKKNAKEDSVGSRWLDRVGISPTTSGEAAHVLDPTEKRRLLTLWSRAQDAFQKGRYFTALGHLRPLEDALRRSCAAWDSRLIEALQALGDCHFFIGADGDAIEAYERILSVDESHSLEDYGLWPVLDHLVQLYERNGRGIEAGSIRQRAQDIQDRYAFDVWDPQGSRIGRRQPPR